jgi:hypothetical protein
MLGKKLLTLACAAGILAFGACFGGFDKPSPPPPLAPRIDLQGIQSIQVVVKNASQSHHLDPSALAQAVVNRINWLTEGTGIRAHDQTYPADAFLDITVLKESATPISPLFATDVNQWSILVSTSATLTRVDGLVIWRETRVSNPLSRRFTAGDVENLWAEPDVRDFLPLDLSSGLVHRMFYGN